MLRRGTSLWRTILIAILMSVLCTPSDSAQSSGSRASHIAPAHGSSGCTTSVIFSDDFSDGNADGWDTYGDGVWYVYQHQYIVDMGSGINLRGISVVGDAGWTDYAYELDLRADTGVDKAILVRYQDDDNLYMMDIVGVHNFASLVKVENGVATTLVTANYPHDNDQWHHVETIVHGNHVVTRVDGEVVIDYIDAGSTLTHGKIGLQGWTGEWGTDKVRFDNVVVRQLCLLYFPLVLK